MKKKLGKEHRYISMYIELANADLEMYITTGNHYYLERAREILEHMNQKCGDEDVAHNN